MALRELSMLEIVIRILIAVVFSGIIGMERGLKNRAAGFRTYMLVCLGAVLTILLGQYEHHMLTTAWAYSAQAAGLKTDVARFGAQVISGIGFLGAGTIVVTRRNQIKGLTTAAGLWAAAGVGLALGIGFYEAAIAGAIAVFFVMTMLQKMDNRMHRKSKQVEAYFELSEKVSLGDFLRVLRTKELEVDDVQREQQDEQGGSRSYIATFRSKTRRNHQEIAQILREIDGVEYLEEL